MAAMRSRSQEHKAHENVKKQLSNVSKKSHESKDASASAAFNHEDVQVLVIILKCLISMHSAHCVQAFGLY